MTHNRAVLAAVALVVLVAGCGAAGSGDAGGDGGRAGGGLAPAGGGGVGVTSIPAATSTPMPTGAASRDGASDAARGKGPDEVRSRAVVRTGRVALEVEEFGAARRNLTRAARRYGGFVSDSRRRLHRVDGQTYTTGSVVLRVPKENFTALMSRVEAEGTVLESNTDADDVTRQLVDIDARLENLRAQRDQLRELYRRANDTESVLKVQERLSAVQTEIERLEAREKTLKNRVALSTVRVELREPRPEPAPAERWYDTPIAGAFLESVHGVTVVARAAVVAFAYALPYLLAFGVPLALLAAALAWRRGAFGAR